MMTHTKAVDLLKECGKSSDPEVAHLKADDVLTELLESLGYQDVVDAYEQVPKWYA